MILLLGCFFFALTIAGTCLVLFTKNVIHAAYGLGLVLLIQAGIFVLLNAELLAVTQILLYAGGVVIILVFGVMMSSRKKGLPITESRNILLPAVISLSCFVALIWVFSDLPAKADPLPRQAQIKQIGVSFLTDHLIAFELIAFVLLVVLVGASHLAKVSTNEKMDIHD